MNATQFAKKNNLVKGLALTLCCYLWTLVPAHADENTTEAVAEESSTVQIDLTQDETPVPAQAEAVEEALTEAAAETQEAVTEAETAVAEKTEDAVAEVQMVEQLGTEATEAAAEEKPQITGVLQTTEEGQAAETKIQESVVADTFKAKDDEAKRKLLDEELQDLKKDILETNRDLFILEEDLLFPSSTQVKVFFSIDVGEYFKLDSVTLKLNNKDITHHLYTEREVDALSRGAVQRLVTENISTGEHELVATILGFGPKGREYRRAAAFEFEKSTGAKYIHLTIRADSTKQQPEFAFKEWD